MKCRIDHPLGEIEVTRKRIRNLYLRLGETPDSLRVSVPVRLSDAEIRAFVTARAEWIRRQREKIARRPPGWDPGSLPESIHLLGHPHALKAERDPELRPGKATVCTQGDRLVITSRDGDMSSIRAALRSHCRSLLDRTLRDRLPQWTDRMGLPLPEHRIRRMKTRWGTCNIRDRRIWLNLELARMPVEVIDLVVVHELAHLIERGHNARFYAVMDRHYPAWREHEPALERYGIVGL